MQTFALALALLAAAPGLRDNYRRPRANTNPNVALQVLPAGGGQSGLVPGCTAVQSADRVGNWLCWDATNGNFAGSAATFANVGSPATQTLATCPNGPNCASVSRLRVAAATDYAKTGNTTFPAGSHSLCWLGSIDGIATNQELLVKANPLTVAGSVTGIEVLTNAVPEFFISNGAAFSIVAGGTMTPRARHLLCGTYQLVGAGTSVMKFYVDGPQVGSTLSTAGALAGLTLPFDIGRSDNGTNPLTGSTEMVFETETVLSATSVSQLASAVLGSLSGSGGEALTFTRASAAGCENEDGSVVVDLPNNRPCVSRAGVLSRSPWTELLLRTSEMDNAAWTKDGNVTAPTVTANTTDVAAPDGTFTAEKIVFPSVAAPNYSRVYQTYTATAAPYSEGVWVRTLSGTCSQYLTTYPATPTLPASTLCSAGTTWTRCKVENVTKNVATWFTVLGNDRSGGSPLSDTTGCTLYAWRAISVQAGALAPGGVDASASTASVAIDNGQMTLPAPLSATEGCARATFRPFYTGNPILSHYILYSAANGRLLYANAAATAGCGDNSNCIAAYDGTHTVGIAGGFTAGVAKTYRVSWSAARNLLKVENVTDGTNSTSVFTSFTFGANLQVGSDGSANASNGYVSDVVVGTSPDGCN